MAATRVQTERCAGLRVLTGVDESEVYLTSLDVGIPSGVGDGERPATFAEARGGEPVFECEDGEFLEDPCLFWPTAMRGTGNVAEVVVESCAAVDENVFWDAGVTSHIMPYFDAGQASIVMAGTKKAFTVDKVKRAHRFRMLFVAKDKAVRKALCVARAPPIDVNAVLNNSVLIPTETFAKHRKNAAMAFGKETSTSAPSPMSRWGAEYIDLVCRRPLTDPMACPTRATLPKHTCGIEKMAEHIADVDWPCFAGGPAESATSSTPFWFHTEVDLLAAIDLLLANECDKFRADTVDARPLLRIHLYSRIDVCNHCLLVVRNHVRYCVPALFTAKNCGEFCTPDVVLWSCFSKNDKPAKPGQTKVYDYCCSGWETPRNGPIGPRENNMLEWQARRLHITPPATDHDNDRL